MYSVFVAILFAITIIVCFALPGRGPGWPPTALCARPVSGQNVHPARTALISANEARARLQQDKRRIKKAFIEAVESITKESSATLGCLSLAAWNAGDGVKTQDRWTRWSFAEEWIGKGFAMAHAMEVPFTEKTVFQVVFFLNEVDFFRQ